MRQRKEIDWGKDTPPGKAWSAYRGDLHRELVDSLTQARLREGISAPKEESAPGG